MSARRLAGAVGLVLALGAAHAEAQNADQLRTTARDRNGIFARVVAALPKLHEAQTMVARAATPAEMNQALDTVYETYAYLRAAQEGAEGILKRSTFQDPLIRMQMQQAWEVRKHLLKCLDIRGHLERLDPAVVPGCVRNLTLASGAMNSLLMLVP